MASYEMPKNELHKVEFIKDELSEEMMGTRQKMDDITDKKSMM